MAICMFQWYSPNSSHLLLLLCVHKSLLYVCISTAALKVRLVSPIFLQHPHAGTPIPYFCYLPIFTGSSGAHLQRDRGWRVRKGKEENWMQIYIYNLSISLSLQFWTANPVWAGELGSLGSGLWQLWLGMDEWTVVPKGVKQWKACQSIGESAPTQRPSLSQLIPQKVDLLS